jgi:flagellar protein FliO/FliZ
MTRLVRGVVFLGLGLLLTPLLPAAEKPATAADPTGVIYPRPAGVPAESVSGSSPRYLPTLVAVLVMGSVGGWLFWRARRTPSGVAPLRKLAVAETKSLGNRQFLVVATYDDKKYLLSVCPGRIDLLTQLEGSAPAKSS